MRGLALRLLGSAAAVTAVTGAVFALRPHVPVLSLAALYIVAVLAVAAAWGMAYAVAVAVASMLAFNWFFLEPVHTFTLADSRNWFALVVFLVTAVVVSELAARSRRQAREAALLAGIATSLLERGSVSAELERIAEEAARALEVEEAWIELGPQPSPVDAPGVAHPLNAADRRVGTIRLQRPRRGSGRARSRLLPALASLLGVAIDRERLAHEAVEAEALRRSDAMKTAVLRAVSHDLRSPLMAILTSAGALAHGRLALDEADRADLVETILDEARRLDRLVGNLLDLSRLQAGAAAPERGIWAVEDLVLQAIDAGDAAGRVDVVLPEEDSPTVLVDPHQVERVLANLVENALRYSPPGEPVRIDVREAGGEVAVRVVDRGPGIPRADLERIFEPFQRGPGAADTRGAGLGLAIARGFAEANGGRVWVESHEGQGSTFLLSLPVARVSAEAPA